MPGNCPVIRHLRDPDILTQPAVGQAVAPKKRPPEGYFPRRLSIIGPDLTSDRLFTIIARGVRATPPTTPFPTLPRPKSTGTPGRACHASGLGREGSEQERGKPRWVRRGRGPATPPPSPLPQPRSSPEAPCNPSCPSPAPGSTPPAAPRPGASRRRNPPSAAARSPRAA